MIIAADKLKELIRKNERTTQIVVSDKLEYYEGFRKITVIAARVYFDDENGNRAVVSFEFNTTNKDKVTYTIRNWRTNELLVSDKPLVITDCKYLNLRGLLYDLYSLYIQSCISELENRAHKFNTIIFSSIGKGNL